MPRRPESQSAVQSTPGRRGCGWRVTVTLASLTGVIAALNPGDGTPLLVGSYSLVSRGARQPYRPSLAQKLGDRAGAGDGCRRVCQIGIPMNYHHPVDWLTLWALYEGAFAVVRLIC